MHSMQWPVTEQIIIFLGRPESGVKAKNDSFLKVLIWMAIGDPNPFSGIKQNRFILLGREIQNDK